MTSIKNSTTLLTEALLTTFRDVGKQCHLARAFDRDRDLTLMAAARARNPAGADLAPLGDVPAQLVDVLVVDLVDLVLAEEAGLPPDRAGLARALAPRLPVPVSFSSARRHQNGMSSSADPVKSSLPAVAAAGTNWRSPSAPPSPRLPRNWTVSAMISTAWRLVPSWASHSRQSRRPSTPTGRPLERYCEQLSPWLPQTVTSK